MSLSDIVTLLKFVSDSLLALLLSFNLPVFCRLETLLSLPQQVLLRVIKLIKVDNQLLIKSFRPLAICHLGIDIRDSLEQLVLGTELLSELIYS